MPPLCLRAGLAAVGVALVAVAAKGLVSKASKGPLTSIILLLSACISFIYSAPWLFPALILAGGCVTLAVHTLKGRRTAMAVRRPSSHPLPAPTRAAPNITAERSLQHALTSAPPDAAQSVQRCPSPP